ncbi:MAG: helix-turn-helix domain-containing protein [Bacteroidota bacterium]
MNQDQMYRVFFVVPPEVQLLDVSGPAHIFYEAKEYDAPIASYFLSLDNESTQVSSTGLSLGNLQSFQHFELGSNDWLIVPGLESHLIFDPDFIERLQPFLEWLKRQASNQAKICSVCTGAYLLAFAGILDEKACTTHWKYLKDFHRRFPKVLLQKDRLFVKDQTIYSSAGVSSGIDLSLFLLEEQFGPVFATKIAKEVVVYLRRTESDPQLSIFLQYRNHIEHRIHQVQDLLAQKLEQKLKAEEIANIVNMSARNLTRLFKKTTGITIGEYVNKLRVERAVQLLSEGNKVQYVSSLCGLNSPNQLRELLQKYEDALPSELLKSS